MMFSKLCGILLLLVSFSELILGDATSVLTISTVKVVETECGYFGPWSFNVQNGQRSSQINGNIPVLKELPPTMTLSINIYLYGPKSAPVVYNMTICDALDNKLVGATFVKAGVPKESFPKECPFAPGPWSVEKWDPPAELIPTGVPDGPISGQVIFGDEDEEPCVTLHMEGHLSHAFMGIGR